MLGGPDVWELIVALRAMPGRGEPRLRRLASELGLQASQVHAALDFYAEHPDEIDERIAANERTVKRLRVSIQRRDRLLSR